MGWGSLISIHLHFHKIFFSDPNSRSLPMLPPLASIFSFSFIYFFQFSIGLVFYACWQFLPYFDTHKRVWLKWSPISFGPLTFGPWEIWSPRNWGPRNLVSEKFSPPRHLVPAWKSFFTILCRDQISRGPNEIGDHFSCSFKKDFTPMLI